MLRNQIRPISPHQRRLETRDRINAIPQPLRQLPIRVRANIQHPAIGQVLGPGLQRYIGDIEMIAFIRHQLITDRTVFVAGIRHFHDGRRQRHEEVLRRRFGPVPVGCVQGDQLFERGGLVVVEAPCLARFQ